MAKPSYRYDTLYATRQGSGHWASPYHRVGFTTKEHSGPQKISEMAVTLHRVEGRLTLEFSSDVNETPQLIVNGKVLDAP